MPDIVVAITNGNVHCDVCGMKITIKKASFLWASIMPTTRDHAPFNIEGKWLEVLVGMLKVDFLIQPHPKQV